MITPIRGRVLAETRTWLGTPYRHLASRKGIGCDCIGQVRGVWRALYGAEPAPIGVYLPDWAEAGAGEPLLDGLKRHFIETTGKEPLPGNVLAFRWRSGLCVKHVGILDQHGRLVHAYQGKAVVASAMVPQWRRRIAGVFAFPPILNEFERV